MTDNINVSMGDKAEIRKLLLEKRRQITHRKKKDRLICERFFTLDLCFDTVLIYVSCKGEPDTLEIIKRLLEMKKRVYAPRCLREKTELEFCEISDLDELKEGVFGILEPRRDAPRLEITRGSLCIVPGLSFSYDGGRIGYGKGYYDRFLSKNPIFSVGLCYEFMMSNSLPQSCFDKKVDIILTEKKEVLISERQEQ